MFNILIAITIIIISIDLLMKIWRDRLRSDMPNVKIKFNKFIWHMCKNPARYKLEVFHVLMKDGVNELSDDYCINLIFGVFDSLRYMKWHIGVMINTRNSRREISSEQYKAESQVDYLMKSDAMHVSKEWSDLDEQ